VVSRKKTDFGVGRFSKVIFIYIWIL